MSVPMVTEDWREIREAVAISLAAHVAIVLLIAVLGWVPKPTLEFARTEYEAPVELNLIDLPPQVEPPPAESTAVDVPPPQFVQLPSRADSAEEDLLVRETVSNARFESARELRGGSEKPGTGDSDLPAQKGRESEALQIAPAPSTAAALQSPAPAPDSAVPLPTPGEIPASVESEPQTPPSEMFLDSALEEPESSGDLALWDLSAPARRETTQPDLHLNLPRTGGMLNEPVRMAASSRDRLASAPTNLDGGIEELGLPGVEAAATAAGVYKQRVVDLIGNRWQRAIERRLNMLQPGTVRVRFSIDNSGKIGELRVVSNSSNPITATITLNAISGTSIPPIPPAILESLPTGKMEIDFFFSVNE